MYLAAPGRGPGVKRYSYLFILLGALFLIFLIRKLGAQELWDCFHRLGWKLVLPILIFLPQEILRALSWSEVLKALRQKVPFFTLYRIRLAGEAVNSLTPFNFAGGDPFKAWALSSQKFSGGTAVSSVVIERTLQILATVLIIVAGTFAGLAVLPLTPAARRILIAALGFLLGVILILALFKKRGFFRSVSRVLEFLRVRRFVAASMEKLESQDRPMREFYAKSPGVFLSCLALHLASKALTVVEIAAIGSLLGVPMTVWQALFIASVVPITNMVMGFIPGSLGALEGVMGGVFHVLHWNPAVGVSLQLVRRIRQAFYVSLGFLVFHFSTPYPAKPAALS